MSDDFCPRQIVFEIPGMPGVKITATEDNGSIVFDVDVLDSALLTGDLRALFFDINEDRMAGMMITDNSGGVVTDDDVQANRVIDLGNGANVRGLTREAFDVGVEFGSEGIGMGDDVTGPVSFTLTNAAGDLTLDDIAHQRFAARVNSTGEPGGGRGGSEKILFVAPAAPDALDDEYDVFEDGAGGLDDPSKTPSDLIFNVLENDTDADGDDLTITAIHEQPDHGFFTIAADGKSLIYTPELDYSGTVSVEYCISDGNGGQDSAVATIEIAAVADEPVITWTVAQGATINEMIITVTATQDDADSSEFLKDLVASFPDGLPAGATLDPLLADPVGEPDQIVQQFKLTTVGDTSYNFGIAFTATSEETSNGDTENHSEIVPILIDYVSTTQDATFTATDQSIWSTGDQFTFVDDRFLGVDTGYFNESFGDELYAGVEGDIRLGFESRLEFEGGEIDAVVDYDLTVDTTYNRTTDFLNIATSSLLTNALFNTEGPEGSYTLDFVWDVFLRAYAGVDIGPLEEEISLGTIDVGPGSLNVIDLDSDSLGGTITLPPPLQSFSVNFAWPNISTSGGTPLPLDSSGASNDFLQLVLDIDQLVSQIAFGGVNPFDPPRIEVGPFYADADLLDVDVFAGLNFLQDFLLQMGDVVGTIVFEDSSTQVFTFGDELFFGSASLIDAGGNNNGLVDFTFFVGPEADLTNETALGINVGVDISLFSIELGAEVAGIGYSEEFGPLASFGAVAPVAEIPVFNDTFELAFLGGEYAFYA